MSFDANEDYSYLATDEETIRRMVIEHTTGRWETAKSVATKVCYIIVLGIVIYMFWIAWQLYFWLIFFAAIPFNIWIALKVVRVPLRWFLQIDITSPQLNLYGVPKKWSWDGTALTAKDNKDNQLAIVHTINIKPNRRSVKTSMALSDIDRMEWLQDAKVLDRTLDRLENASAHLHYLQRTFYNQLIDTIRRMQLEGVGKPIKDFIQKDRIKLQQVTVNKRGETNVSGGDDED